MITARPRTTAAAAFVAACWTTLAGAQALRLEADFASAREDMDPVNWVRAQATPAPSPRSGSPLFGAPPPVPQATTTWAATILPFIDSGDPVGFAPARWGGTIGMEYLAQRADETRWRNQVTGTVNLNAASYFWQPWFAQVTGTMTVLGSATRGGDLERANTPSGFTPNYSLSGGGTLAVFPSSRFPFLGSFHSTDSRATGEFTASDYRSTRASLRQTWRDPLGTTTFAGGLDYNSLDSSSFGRDTVVQLDGRYLGTLDPHRIDAAIAWSRNRRNGGDEGSDIARAYGTHLYTPNSELWVSSLANLSEMRISGIGTTPALTQRIGQLSSQAVWRPGFDDRLVLTGGGRVFLNQFSRGDSSDTADSLSANAGATFAITEEATLNAAVSATDSSVGEGRRMLITTQNLGGTYVSRPFAVGFADYSFSASLQGAHQTGGPEDSRSAGSAQADHQVSRTVNFGPAVAVNLLATQGGGVTEDSLIGRTDTLRAGVSAGLRIATSETSDAYLGASYSGSDSRGGINDRFRLANVQANGQVRFGAYDSLSANLTAQWVRSSRDELAAEESTRQVFGGITYQNTRVFGVPRLRYQLSATLNDGIQTTSRLLGDIDAPRENVSRLVDSRLLYDIGRLELRIGTRLAKVDGRSDVQWYLRVYRQIGQY